MAPALIANAMAIPQANQMGALQRQPKTVQTRDHDLPRTPDGSIVCPANPERVGELPILGALTGVDPRDPATQASAGKFFTDYTRFLNPDGLKGARIGVARDSEGFSPHLDAVFENALTAMQNAGAILVDVFFPHFGEIFTGAAEFTVLLFDFKGDIAQYFATRSGVPLAGGTLADAIAFNDAHAAQEMPFFGQEIFLAAHTLDLKDPATIATYNTDVARDRLIGGTEGIDFLLQQNSLDAIVAPTDNPSCRPT